MRAANGHLWRIYSGEKLICYARTFERAQRIVGASDWTIHPPLDHVDKPA